MIYWYFIFCNLMCKVSADVGNAMAKISGFLAKCFSEAKSRAAEALFRKNAPQFKLSLY